MPRKKTQKPAEDMTQNIDVAALEQAQKQKDKHDKALAETDAVYGDGLPYNTNRLINETRFYLQQTADAMLEAGKRLIVLKEHEPHGEFTEALEKIGIDPRTARKMIQAAYKFSDSKRPTLAVLGKSRLLELMAEDDDDLDELAEGGTIAGHTVDEIQCMTVRELRESLRKERESRHQDQEVNERMLTSKNSKIDKLDKKIHDLQTTAKTKPWPKRVEEINIETTIVAGGILQSCDQLDVLRDAILNEPFGEEDKEAAIASMAIFYYDALSQVIDRVTELGEFCDEVFVGYKSN